MDVSVVIINYNTKEILRDCLLSIQKETIEIIYEVIVVDNASVDGSVEMLKEQFSWVTVICSSENLGFGKANNLGVKHARGKYVFLLNSDTLLINNAIKSFFEFMESNNRDENIGAIGGLLLDVEYNESNSYSYFPSIHSDFKSLLYRMLNIRYTNTKYINDLLPVDYITGADLFIPKKIYDKLEGFDPNYFMYYEETDLQKRMKDRGLMRLIIPTIRIIHLEGGSFSKKGLVFNKFMMSQKSMNIYIHKHFGKLHACIYMIMMALLRLRLVSFTDWTLKEKRIAYRSLFKR